MNNAQRRRKMDHLSAQFMELNAMAIRSVVGTPMYAVGCVIDKLRSLGMVSRSIDSRPRGIDNPFLKRCEDVLLLREVVDEAGRLEQD